VESEDGQGVVAGSGRAGVTRVVMAVDASVAEGMGVAAGAERGKAWTSTETNQEW
jgi:hypothetical protein